MNTNDCIQALQIHAAKQSIMIDQLSLIVGSWLSPEQLQSLRASTETLGEMLDQETGHSTACLVDLKDWLDGLENSDFCSKGLDS